MKKLLFLVAAVAMLGGCFGNGFTKFYDGQNLEQVQASGLQTCETPVLRDFPSDGPEAALIRMLEEGYDLIGTSSWEGPSDEGNAEALAQGQLVGACVVMWKAEYSHTRQGSMPMSVYTPGGTSTTIHSGTVYSGGSSGMYSGTSTTYNPGAITTQYIPYSVNRYTYSAAYFAKLVLNPQGLNIFTLEPPVEYMKATDSRDGWLVTAVVKGGNAYKANIFRGDVIVSINGTPCIANSANVVVSSGKNILKIWRDGKIIEKVVDIPSS